MTVVAPATATVASNRPKPALRVRGLRKQFADVVAADGIDLELAKGEIHAVLGENGAGKSTLMKMLYGYYHPDAGEIEVDGRLLRFHSPADARRAGIGMVFQSFTLVPALTVLENIALVDKGRSLRFDRVALADRIRQISERYRLEVRPEMRVSDLSMGERQRVEILKLLTSDASILIFDEPTSVLAPQEVEGLLEVLGKLRSDGYAIVLITHKMREVFACADRVTVLRRGRVIGQAPIGEINEADLLSMMLGERIEGSEQVESARALPVGRGIELHGVSVSNPDGGAALYEVELSVPRGQIVGVAAVAGNGQAALADVIAGTAKLRSGSVSLGEIDVTRKRNGQRLRLGLRTIPEDPVTMGAVGALTVRENLMLTSATYEGKGRVLIRPGVVRRTAAAIAERAPFPLPHHSRALQSLSGGNVQRVVLARELQGGCHYLVAYYPSRGLDVASTRAVQQLMVNARDAGGAVLLISEDLDELRALSDQVVVMHHGRIVGSFTRDDFDLMRVGHLMTGGHAA